MRQYIIDKMGGHGLIKEVGDETDNSIKLFFINIFMYSEGIWELSINPKTNVIYHFNFIY
jgi:hypothetical protein